MQDTIKPTTGHAENTPVNHPIHYNAHPSGVECITIIECFNLNIGNAVKYLWRAGLKEDAVEDLKKAKWYVDREIARLEEPQPLSETGPVVSDNKAPLRPLQVYWDSQYPRRASPVKEEAIGISLLYRNCGDTSSHSRHQWEEYLCQGRAFDLT